MQWLVERQGVSDSDAPKTDTPVAAPAESAPAAPPAPDASSSTRFELVQKLTAEKRSREEILSRLKSEGLDEESAKVLLNAVSGPNPSELPEPTLSPGINPLAPSTFSISDIGMSGSPATVGAYWLTFGVFAMVVVAVFFVLVSLDIVAEPSQFSVDASKVLLFFGLATAGWGAIKLLSSVNFKRRD